MRLCWLTDIHLDFVGPSVEAALFEQIRAAEPDAVLLGGDIAIAPTVAPKLNAIATALARPVYFVLGNHDYYHGRFREVRDRVATVAAANPWLTWLETAAEPLALTPHLGLVGHAGWGDARYGDYETSQAPIADFGLIGDLVDLDLATRRERLMGLGDEAAAHLRTVLPRALERFERVLVLCHVPPFDRAAWYQGQMSNPHYLPFFSCRAAGEAILEAAEAHPEREILVLCGHTHGEGEAQIRERLVCLTAAAEYRRPQIARVLDL